MLAAVVTTPDLCSGGLELLVNNQKKHALLLSDVPIGDDADATIEHLVSYIASAMIRPVSRVDMFLQFDTVRPGILVLINDCDWELHGANEYVLQANDTIVFISTLHGG